MKKRIVIIVNQFPKSFSGVGDYTYNLCNELKEYDLDIHIFTRSNQELVSTQYTIHPFITGWKRRHLKKIIENIQRLKPNLVLLQYEAYAYQPYGIPPQIIYLIKKTNLYATTAIFFHETFGRKKPLAVKRWLNVSFQETVVKRLMKIVQIPITSTPFYAKQLEALYDKKVHLIRIGSNIPTFRVELSELEELRLKYQLNKKFIVGTFGHSLRSIEVILQSVPLLVEKHSDFKLLLIGHFPNRIKVKIKYWVEKLNIESHIVQTGKCAARDIFRFLNLVDIYLMLEPVKTNNVWTGTSTRSTTLATAMMMGLTIIGTKGDKTDAFLEHLENIYLLESLNPRILLRAITEIRNNEDLSVKLSRNAQISYQKELNWAQIARQHNLLFGGKDNTNQKH